MRRLGYAFSPRSTELMVYGQMDWLASAVSAGLTTAPDPIGWLVLCTIMPWPSVSLEKASFSVSSWLLLSAHSDSTVLCESASRTTRESELIFLANSPDVGFSIVWCWVVSSVWTIAWKMRPPLVDNSWSAGCVTSFTVVVVPIGNAAL